MCVSSSCIICDDDITFNFNMSVREKFNQYYVDFCNYFYQFF